MPPTSGWPIQKANEREATSHQVNVYAPAHITYGECRAYETVGWRLHLHPHPGDLDK
jgi:hypothetical protein